LFIWQRDNRLLFTTIKALFFSQSEGAVYGNFCTTYLIIHQVFLLVKDWSKRVTWLPQFKLRNIRVNIPNFQKIACCEKYLKDITLHYSLYLAGKDARIFVLGDYAFENCWLLGTSIVPNRGYRLYHQCL